MSDLRSMRLQCILPVFVLACSAAQTAKAGWTNYPGFASYVGQNQIVANPSVEWDRSYWDQHSENRWIVPAVRIKGRLTPAAYFFHINENPNMNSLVWLWAGFRSFRVDNTTPFPAPGAPDGVWDCQANTPAVQTQTSTFSLTQTSSATDSWNRSSSFEKGLQEGISEEIDAEENALFVKFTEKTTFSFQASQKWTNTWGESHDQTRTQSKAYTKLFSDTAGINPGFTGTPSVSVPYAHIDGGFALLWVDRAHPDVANSRFYAYPVNPSGGYWTGRLDIPLQQWNGTLPLWGVLPRLMTIAQYRQLCPGDFSAHIYAPSQKEQLCRANVDRAHTCH